MRLHRMISATEPTGQSRSRDDEGKRRGAGASRGEKRRDEDDKEWCTAGQVANTLVLAFLHWMQALVVTSFGVMRVLLEGRFGFRSPLEVLADLDESEVEDWAGCIVRRDMVTTIDWRRPCHCDASKLISLQPRSGLCRLGRLKGGVEPKKGMVTWGKRTTMCQAGKQQPKPPGLANEG